MANRILGAQGCSAFATLCLFVLAFGIIFVSTQDRTKPLGMSILDFFSAQLAVARWLYAPSLDVMPPHTTTGRTKSLCVLSHNWILTHFTGYHSVLNKKIPLIKPIAVD